MSQHPEPEALDAYVMGQHEGLAVDEIEAHVSGCRDCFAVVRRGARLELAMLDIAGELSECPSCRHVTATSRCGACGAALQAGEFRVLRVVVQNAHGRLYLAENAIGGQVALKELAFVHAPGADVLAAFEREAKFLRALAHPDIPRFVASFQDGEGVHTRLFLAQEYIDGESLHSRLNDHWFDEDEAIDTARKILAILVYLQDLSPIVVHGDIKPANLVRRSDGSIALVDFGAARSFNATTTSIAGTFGYMPIEQLAGIVNPTTDLYGLGASLVHLLSREDPWKLLEDPASLGRLNVSPELRRFLAKLTARRVNERFANARTALEALLRLRASARRRRIPMLAASLAAGALLAGAGGYGIARLTADHPSAGPLVSVKATLIDDPRESDPGLDHEPPFPQLAPTLTRDFLALYAPLSHSGVASYSIDMGVDSSSAVYLPDTITDIAHDSKTGQWYAINDFIFGTWTWPSAFHSLEIPGAPSLNNPTAIAFDDTRRRIIVATQSDEGGDHFLYAFAVDTNKWSTLANIGPLEIDSLTYMAEKDRFFGLSGGFLSTVDADGKILETRAVADADLTDAELVAFRSELYIVSSASLQHIEVDYDPMRCDADTSKDKGMQNINMGQHAAALAQFEASLRCKDDPYVRQLAFMESCASANSTKAKLYYAKLSPAQQAKFAQICIRQKPSVPYQ